MPNYSKNRYTGGRPVQVPDATTTDTLISLITELRAGISRRPARPATVQQTRQALMALEELLEVRQRL